MVEVDGSEGGGQLFRTALTLATLTGEPVEVTNVRGNRTDPGLRAQHLTALETVAEVADAEVEGAELDAETVAFDPDGLSGGHYEADIGTAGSITLLFDTFLPLATVIDEPLTVTAVGGTDVKWSPPLSYYRQVKLPLLRRLGVAVAVECDRHGFYPEGGGRARLHLWPSSVDPIRLEAPMGRPVASVFSTAARDLAEGDVAVRQADAAVEAIEEMGIEVATRRTRYVATDSPGSVLTVGLDGPAGRAGFAAYGAPAKRADDLAGEVTDAVRRFRESGGAVDAHLADQLQVVLALAGGRLAVPAVTDHIQGNQTALEAFDRAVDIDRSGEAPTLVVDR